MSLENQTIKPLQGFRVVGVEQFIAGPYCTMMLADMGAEVIKIERPGSGEPRRSYDPMFQKDGKKMSGGFMSYNRNKKSLSLDLQKKEGQEIFKALMLKTDIVVENMRPGTMDKLGLGYEELQKINPRLIYAAISGYGRMKGMEGPYSARPAFDPTMQAFGGIANMIGEQDGPPMLAPTGITDVLSGIVNAYSVCVALLHRYKTEKGQFVDTAMYDSIVSLLERAMMIYDCTGDILERGGDKFAPVGIFKAGDGGYVSVIIPTDDMWAKCCNAIDRNDLLKMDGLSTVLERSKNMKTTIIPVLEKWAHGKTKKEVAEYLNSRGLPAGEVQNIKDLAECPQLNSRQMFLQINDPVAGLRLFPRTPGRLADVKQIATNPAPQLGEHNKEILINLLGYTEDTYNHLKQSNVV